MSLLRKSIQLLLPGLVALQVSGTSYGQYPYQDKWYQNPLGFKPLSLHTSMGFIVPALVTGTALLLTQKDTSLRQRLGIYTEAGATFGYKYPYTNIMQHSTGMNWLLRKWLSVGAEFSATMPFDDYNNSLGFAIRPFARFYAVNSTTWKLWFESGGGLICFTSNFPKPTSQDSRLGTYLNGVTKYGIGVSAQLPKHMQLIFGARHLHISNGNRKGADRNPSHDSNGLFAGLSWAL